MSDKPLSEKGQPLQFFEKNTQYFVLEDVKEAVDKLKEEFCLLERDEDCKCLFCSGVNKIFGFTPNRTRSFE